MKIPTNVDIFFLQDDSFCYLDLSLLIPSKVLNQCVLKQKHDCYSLIEILHLYYINVTRCASAWMPGDLIIALLSTSERSNETGLKHVFKLYLPKQNFGLSYSAALLKDLSGDL